MFLSEPLTIVKPHRVTSSYPEAEPGSLFRDGAEFLGWMQAEEPGISMGAILILHEGGKITSWIVRIAEFCVYFVLLCGLRRIVGTSRYGDILGGF